jgi:hypothetical protein
VQVWWVYGPSGVAKSVTSWRLFEDLAADDVASAYVDIDQLGMCYPALDADPWRDRLKGRVLAGIAGTYADAGCDRLVVSGVVDPGLMGWYADRLDPHRLTLCRLAVDDAELTRRLTARGVDDAWVADALEEAHDLEAAELPHAVVDTGVRWVGEVSAAVRAALAQACPGVGPGDPDDESPAPPADLESRALCVTGPTAVGKSSVAFEVFLKLREETTVAYVDLEQLGFTRGVSGDQRFANAAVAWHCFRAAGARRLVMSGRLERADERRVLAEAVAPAPLHVAGLTADETAYVERVAARGRGGPPELAGDPLLGADPEELAVAAARAWAEQQRDAHASGWDAAYDTTDHTAAEVAEQVLTDWR